jgi:hypothetical protein
MVDDIPSYPGLEEFSIAVRVSKNAQSFNRRSLKVNFVFQGNQITMIDFSSLASRVSKSY